jgi:hypothetical protein
MSEFAFKEYIFNFFIVVAEETLFTSMPGALQKSTTSPTAGTGHAASFCQPSFPLSPSWLPET